MKNKNMIRGFLLLLALNLVTISAAQVSTVRDAFNTTAVSLDALNESQNERLAVIQRNEILEHPVVIEFVENTYNTLVLRFYFDIETHDILTFPNKNTIEILANRTDIQVFKDSYAWAGDLYSNDQYTGDITLVVDRNGEVSGTIDIEGLFFKIYPLGHNIQLMAKVSEKAMIERDNKLRNHTHEREYAPSQSPPSIEESSLKSKEPNSSFILTNPRCSPEVIRLLVLYTAAAAQGRNIQNLVNLALQESNESYSNSQISNMRIAVNHIQQFSFTETSDIGNDLNALKINTNVKNLRNLYNADVVILITDGNYGSISGAAIGIFPESEEAYAIVQADYATGPEYTFTHEIGHLQGGQHVEIDPVMQNPPFPVAYGHRFSYPGGPIFSGPRRRSTIMAYTWSPLNFHHWARRKHISNPNVNYSGTPTGTSTRNNTTALIPTWPVIADYRNPNELGTGIQTAYVNPATGSYSFTALPCGGNGNYSYQWFISSDPFSFGSNPISTQSVFPYQFPEGNWFIKLRVTDAQSHQAEFITSVVVYPSDCNDPTVFCPVEIQVAEQEYTLESKLATSLLVAYPNPFNPLIVIPFSLESSGYVNLEIYDLLGRKVASLVNQLMEAGIHEQRFDASNLSSGTYIVRMQSTGTIFTQQISLVK